MKIGDIYIVAIDFPVYRDTTKRIIWLKKGKILIFLKEKNDYYYFIEGYFFGAPLPMFQKNLKQIF